MKVITVQVDFAGTIPTQPYGNISVKVSWNAELDGVESPEAATDELFRRVRAQVVKAVQPIAEQRLKSVEQALSGLPHDQKEQIMQKMGVFNFLKLANPELGFAESLDNNKESNNAD